MAGNASKEAIAIVASLIIALKKESNVITTVKHWLSIIAVLFFVEPGYTTTLNNQALNYYSEGKYDEAEALFQQTISVLEMTYGANHPQVAAYLFNLAELHRINGRYRDAEPLYQRSLAIREKALGRDHPDVATTLKRMAWLYKKVGKNEEAKEMKKQVKRIRARN